MAQDGWPEISSSQAKPTPTAAPNVSAHVRHLQKAGPDTYDDKLPSTLITTLLQMSFHLKFVSEP
jgi:hypothetical protein